jgi:hypothetical protein
MSLERNCARRGAAGLTLVEMLVTLVLASFISLVLWQALAQLARIERLLQGNSLQGGAVAVRVEWVRSAIQALVPGVPNTPDRLQGNDHELQALTSEPPLDCRAGVCHVHLAIRFDEQTQQTELTVAATEPTGAAPIALLRWPGRSGRISYLGADGQWQPTWPPPLGLKPALPKAIAIDTGARELGVIVAAPRNDELPLPSRRSLENL